MPIKNTDPFDDFIDTLDPQINPYVKRLRDSAREKLLSVGYGSSLKKFVGHWRTEIEGMHLHSASPMGSDLSNHKSCPLILEVGCHQGQTLVSMAETFPQWKFVGIDITFKRIIATGERLQKSQRTNAFCALANAKKLSSLFAPGELDGVLIFFPDPWIKKARQLKNRLMTPEFALELKSVLRPGGFIWFKSDQESYVELTKAILKEAGFVLENPDVKFPEVLGRDFTSAFEGRFREKGLPTFGLVGRLPTL